MDSETGKGQGNMTNSLAGGGKHDLGYYAYLWYVIMHGGMGQFSTYTFCAGTARQDSPLSIRVT